MGKVIIFKKAFFPPTLEMASKISIDNIRIKNHQANFLDPIELEITFTNQTALVHPIEWKIIYFGSAEDEDCDQVLEQFQIPPVEQIQTMKFELSCNPPDFKRIPRSELLCVTAMILTVSYKNEQFIRVGYYIHYQYAGEHLPETLHLVPAEEVVNSTKRTILYDKPRVTKFNIKWDGTKSSASESEKEDKNSLVDEKANEDSSEQKHANQQKQSTLQEKEERSNNFSDHEVSPIECE